MKVFSAALYFALSLAFAPAAEAQEVAIDRVVFIKAEVVRVLEEFTEEIPGTGTKALQQTLQITLLEGERRGEELLLRNDYIKLSEGDVFYLRHAVSGIDGTESYSVSEPYRLPVLIALTGLFLLCLFLFGGMPGVRGLLALAASLFFISYLLLPGILAGYPPALVAVGVASLIILAGSYLTHGVNRTTTAAVCGMLATIVLSGLLAFAAIYFGKLSGYTGDETTYLNFSTRGSLDFVGLLFGGIMIGLLGVLYDAAISQAIAVEELLRAGQERITRVTLYARALRIGREHIGALVNTLAIAYVGAALPLILLFSLSYADQSPLVTLNQEIFAAEIVRTLVGSIGVILAVPVTTAIAVYMLWGRVRENTSAEAEIRGHLH